MVDEDVGAPAGNGDFESREPSVEDLVALCRHLNQESAEYVIVGGFAMRAAGYDRRTMDVNILINTDPEIDGVSIPFASPRLLWKTKAPTRREQDQADLVFLRAYFAERGEAPPDPGS